MSRERRKSAIIRGKKTFKVSGEPLPQESVMVLSLAGQSKEGGVKIRLSRRKRMGEKRRGPARPCAGCTVKLAILRRVRSKKGRCERGKGGTVGDHVELAPRDFNEVRKKRSQNKTNFLILGTIRLS